MTTVKKLCLRCREKASTVEAFAVGQFPPAFLLLADAANTKDTTDD